jgi:hypothetical protein
MSAEHPKMRNRFLGVIAGAAVLAPVDRASAVAFTNGGFESPGAAGVRPQITRSLVPSWTYVPGAGPGGSHDFYESGGQDGLTAADGAHYVSFGHNGTRGGSIYQDFYTVIGTTYTVAYSVAEQRGHDPAHNLRAMVTNGNQVLSRDNIRLSTRFAAGVPITFTARTNLTRLTFFDATPDGGGKIANLALDAVAISGSVRPAEAGVPESTAWVLMLIGVAGMGALMRYGGRWIAPAARNLAPQL